MTDQTHRHHRWHHHRRLRRPRTARADRQLPRDRRRRRQLSSGRPRQSARCPDLGRPRRGLRILPSRGDGPAGLAPGVYFRCLLIWYFEGISSERGIAWRVADSLSLRRFLRLSVERPTPDHSTTSAVAETPAGVDCVRPASQYSQLLEHLRMSPTIDARARLKTSIFMIRQDLAQIVLLARTWFNNTTTRRSRRITRTPTGTQFPRFQPAHHGVGHDTGGGSNLMT